MIVLATRCHLELAQGKPLLLLMDIFPEYSSSRAVCAPESITLKIKHSTNGLHWLTPSAETNASLTS